MYSAKQFGIKVVSKSEDEEICICPFHADNTASASFNTKKGLFYCFVCQIGYTVEQLSNKFDVEFEPNEDEIDDFWNHIFISEVTNRLYGNTIEDWDYLNKRNISKEIVAKHHLEFSNSENAIVIPIFDLYGIRIGVQLRNVNKGWRYKKIGEQTIVWPFQNLLLMDHSKIALIVEGVFSVMRFETIYKGNRIIPFAFMGAKHQKELLQCFNGFNVLIRYDNDKAGIDAANRAVKLYPYYTVTYGTSIDDMSDQEILDLIEEIENEL